MLRSASGAHGFDMPSKQYKLTILAGGAVWTDEFNAENDRSAISMAMLLCRPAAQKIISHGPYTAVLKRGRHKITTFRGFAD